MSDSLRSFIQTQYAAKIFPWPSPTLPPKLLKAQPATQFYMSKSEIKVPGRETDCHK